MVVDELRLDDLHMHVHMHPGELMLPYLLPGRWAWLTGRSRQPYVEQTRSITTSGCVASALTSKFWHAGGSLDQ